MKKKVYTHVFDIRYASQHSAKLKSPYIIRVGGDDDSGGSSNSVTGRLLLIFTTDNYNFVDK